MRIQTNTFGLCIALLLMLTCEVSVLAQFDESTLANRVDFSTGGGLATVGIADLTGDGKLDLVVGSLGTETLYIFPNTSEIGSINSGSFSSYISFGSAGGPHSVAIGDLDGDGKLDLVVANERANNILIFRNVHTNTAFGPASLDSPLSFSVGSSPRFVTLGDLDGDGKPDIIVANTGSGTCSIFRNTSTGSGISFAARVDLSLVAGSYSIAVGDLNGDGKPELVVANTTGSTISVFINTSVVGSIGTDSFQTRIEFNVGSGPFAAAIEDFDRDGKPDIAVANANVNTVSILRSTVSAGIIDSSSFASRFDFSSGGYPYSIATGDLDGDGKPDLAVGNAGSSTVSLYRNTSTSGTIDQNSFQPKVDFPTGGGPRIIRLGDLDGDGKPDLAVANLASPSVSVLRNQTLSSSNQPPIITGQPQDRTVILGETASFSVGASGSQPLFYQWFFNETSIDGATASTLTLSNVQFSQAGNYSVLVSNSVTTVTSAVAVLVVNPAPVCVPPPAGLVAWWTGDGTADDLVGGNHGTLRNGAGFAPGMVGEGFSLDGIDDFVLIPDNRSLDMTSALSFELWFKMTGLGASGAGVFDKRNPSGPVNYGLYISSSGGVNLYYDDPGVSGGDVPGNALELETHFPIPTLNQFHHFAGTYRQADASHIELKMYIDGQVAEVRTFSGNLSNTVNRWPVTIGMVGGVCCPFKGVIDEVSLYSRALSATEIQGIFAAGSAGKCREAVPPTITSQPVNQTATAGETVSFIVSVAGTGPLSYQWRFNGADLNGATQSSLVLSNVRLAQAGDYSVVVANSVGAATSAVAVLVVNLPPATVRVVSANGAGGAEVNVPVELLANGNENALGFSLNFNASVMSFVGASIGVGAPSGAALLVNTNDVSAGRLGLVVGLPADEAFPEGTQQVALVTFLVAPILNQTTETLSFGDQPTLRQLSDVHALVLPAVFLGGTVSIADSQFEGDVAPRPNGNRSVATIDWVQMGRYVARLDSLSGPNEFQRADCAPRATKGNGALTASDWVQAGRYAVGLDPLTVLGGPTEESGGEGGFAAASASSRRLCLVNSSIAQGQTNSVAVTLECQGNENAATFSVVFDPVKLAFVSAVSGPGSAGGLLNLNTTEVTQGRLGVALAAQPGTTFAAGVREILRLRFAARASAPDTASLDFGNDPVPREVSDVAANPLFTDYTAGTVSVTPPPGPPLRVTRSGNSLFITWPSSATGFELEATEGALGTPWNKVAGVIELGEQKLAIVSIGGRERYFRLKKP
jgi:hypothetical protein